MYNVKVHHSRLGYLEACKQDFVRMQGVFFHKIVSIFQLYFLLLKIASCYHMNTTEKSCLFFRYCLSSQITNKVYFITCGFCKAVYTTPGNTVTYCVIGGGPSSLSVGFARASRCTAQGAFLHWLCHMQDSYVASGKLVYRLDISLVREKSLQTFVKFLNVPLFLLSNSMVRRCL